MPWVRLSVSRRQLPPVGFITPCQPTLVEKPPEGPQWSHELKYDGFRMIARVELGRAHVWSRNARDWTASLPRIERALEALPVTSVILDGEAITEDDIGRPDFHGLRSVYGLASAIYVVWDILEFDGRDVRSLPLHARRQLLGMVAENAPDGLLMAETFDDGPALFRSACEFGLEGIVSKRLDSPYRSGRSLAWLKTKYEGYQRPAS